MRNDDLRTLAYKAFEMLGEASLCTGFVSPEQTELFAEAKALGLLDFGIGEHGEIRVFPLASKPPTQVAAVAGIDSHKGMGTK